MTEAQFRHALQVGHGRALLYARNHDVSRFQNVLLEACLHNWAVDPTCEGTRSDFVFEVLETLQDTSVYRDAVVRALPGDLENWDSVHRFWLARQFVEQGDHAVKQALSAAYQPGPRFCENIASCFVSMDGIQGFLFAADKIRELLLNGAQEVDFGWLMSSAEGRFGEDIVRQELDSAAAVNPGIAAYRDVNSASRSPSPDPEWDALPHWTYDELKPKITSRRLLFRLGTWAERTSDAELEKAAPGLLMANDVEAQIAHLRIFSNAPFSLDLEPLFAMATSGDHRLASLAHQALAQRSVPAVRELALRLVETASPHREYSIDLLRYNLKPGDHALALSWFGAETEADILHSYQSSLRHLWETNPEPETEVAMLLALYEKGPCSFLREFEIRRLLELNALPECLREECCWDANDEIRELCDFRSSLPSCWPPLAPSPRTISSAKPSLPSNAPHSTACC